MRTNQIKRTAAVFAMAGVASSGIAMGHDGAADTSADEVTIAAVTTETALERLEAARIAFEAAKAELEAAQTQVAQLTGETVAATTTTDTTAGAEAQPEAEAKGEQAPPDPESWTKGWDWSANVGFNGASGNNENLSARAEFKGQRNTSKYETSLALSYIYGTSDGEKNTSRGVVSLNNDWLTDSKWRYFAQGKYEYDEFQAWDHRVSVAVGLGYELYKDEDTTVLIGRMGIGGYYEMGGDADEKFVPEGLIGLDLRHKISENSTLTASTTYYPSFDDMGEFRWNTNAGLEVVMDAKTGMTLNTGFEHRHDSSPGAGIKPNDVEYYMGLGWKF